MKRFLIIVGVLYFLFPIGVFADIAPDFCRTDKKKCDEYYTKIHAAVAKEERDCLRKGGKVLRYGSFVNCEGGNNNTTTSIKIGDTELIFSYNIIYYIVGSIIILLAIGIAVKHFKDKKKMSNIVNPPAG